MKTTFKESKTRVSWLYWFAISICLTPFFSSCGLFESDVNETGHISQIVVSLDGEDASKEMATVSINGATAGTVTPGNDFLKEVSPGNYDISAKNRTGFIAWSPVTNIKIDTGKTFRYLLHCNKAKLTISIAIECLLPGKAAFPLSVYNQGICTSHIQIPNFHSIAETTYPHFIEIEWIKKNSLRLTIRIRRNQILGWNNSIHII